MATVVLLTGAAATQSRGGAIAAACGGAILLLVAGPRRVLVAVAGPAIGAAVAVAALAPGLPIGHGARPGVAIAGMIAGLGIAAVSTRVSTAPGRRASSLLGVGIGALLAGAGIAISRSGAVSSDRFSLASADRRGTNGAAFDILRAHLLGGVGAGDLRVLFVTPGGLVSTTLVHNEYLQLAVEHGVVGVALFAVVAAVAGRLLVSARHGSGDRWVWNGAVAGLVALAVQSAFDFLWHIPAVVLFGAALWALGCGPAPSVPSNNHERHHT